MDSGVAEFARVLLLHFEVAARHLRSKLRSSTKSLLYELYAQLNKDLVAMNAFSLMKNRLQDISNRHPKAPACLTNGCGGTVAEAGGANRLHNDMLPQLYKCMKPCLKTGGSSLTFSSLSALWEALSLHCLAASFLLKRFSRACNSRPRLPCSSKTCKWLTKDHDGPWVYTACNT